MINLNETQVSIHGEHPFIGAACTIIRLQGCNLNCNYCDTKQAIPLSGGKPESASNLREFILDQNLKDVLLTGGEPLLQSEQLADLIQTLPIHLRISIETNGTIPIDKFFLQHPSVYTIMDYKTIQLNEHHREITDQNLLALSRHKGAVKFVLNKPFDEVKSQKILNTIRFLRGFESLYLIVSFTDKLFAQSWLPHVIEVSKDAKAELRVQMQLHKILEVA